MNKFVALVWLGLLSPIGIASAQDDNEPASSEDLREARTELERAREALEQAAREVARLSAERVGSIGDGVFVERFIRSRRPLLGINIEDADGGVRVAGVTPNGAAEQAGIETGDILVAIDGAALDVTGGPRPSVELLNRLSGVEPGAVVELTVDRNGNAMTIPVTTSSAAARGAFRFDELQGLGPRIAEATRFNLPRGGFALIGNPFAGAAWRDMELVELTPALGAYFGTPEGLLVVRAPEDDAIGLADGDVILTIGGRTPTSVENAMRILASYDPGQDFELEIMREQRRRTVTIAMPAREEGIEDVDVDVRIVR